MGADRTGELNQSLTLPGEVGVGPTDSTEVGDRLYTQEDLRELSKSIAQQLASPNARTLERTGRNAMRAKVLNLKGPNGMHIVLGASYHPTDKPLVRNHSVSANWFDEQSGKTGILLIAGKGLEYWRVGELDKEKVAEAREELERTGQFIEAGLETDIVTPTTSEMKAVSDAIRQSKPDSALTQIHIDDLLHGEGSFYSHEVVDASPIDPQIDNSSSN